MTRSKITGPEIMAWRQGIGQTRKWLAEELGVSAKTVESWEYGTRNPGGPALRLLEQLMKKNMPKPDTD
ncbi:MAG: helix-turn-helix domain-containing protein [Verrucomicrobiales bacterium]|nr:helix-turn-helix domain-containing protein [Verrucomicrobiales bacterium]